MVLLLSALHSLHSKIQDLAQQRRGVIVVFCVALAIKIAMLILLADKPPNVDGIRYLRAAQEMYAGHFSQSLSVYPMPAYPFLIMVVKCITKDWLLAGYLLSSAGLLAATWLLYRISAHLFDQRAAFWGSLAFVLTPFQNEMGVLVYRDPVYLFFLLGPSCGWSKPSMTPKHGGLRRRRGWAVLPPCSG